MRRGWYVRIEFLQWCNFYCSNKFAGHFLLSFFIKEFVNDGASNEFGWSVNLIWFLLLYLIITLKISSSLLCFNIPSAIPFRSSIFPPMTSCSRHSESVRSQLAFLLIIASNIVFSSLTVHNISSFATFFVHLISILLKHHTSKCNVQYPVYNKSFWSLSITP